MNDWLKRILIGLLALGGLGLFVILAFLTLASGITCEDAEDAAFNTVRCDPERGSGWRALQTALILGAGLGLLLGVVRSVSRTRFLPLIVAATVATATFFVVGLIGNIEVGDKPVPRVTEVRLLDDECEVPCPDGFRASITVDRDAEVDLTVGPVRPEDIGDSQYQTTIHDHGIRTAEVDEGTHELSFTSEIVGPPEDIGPMPPGDYELRVSARPQNAGSQTDQTSEAVERRLTVRR